MYRANRHSQWHCQDYTAGVENTINRRNAFINSDDSLVSSTAGFNSSSQGTV
jgi:hypothetical protein